MFTAAGCRNRSGFQHTLADGAFFMPRTVGGSRCRSINNPLAGAVSRNIGLIAAGALMPVVRSIVLPLAAVAVSMFTAAGCRDSFGCHRITADGAFLML